MRYEIGGLRVDMAEDQAERWNEADITEADLDAVRVWTTGRFGGGSRLVDGAVVVDDGLPTSSVMTLREALADADLAAMLDGAEAVRC